jgi:hypothetical protein
VTGFGAILLLLFPRCSHTWELAPALEHRAEFPQFLDQGQLVGLLGRVISSSQGLMPLVTAILGNTGNKLRRELCLRKRPL